RTTGIPCQFCSFLPAEDGIRAFHVTGVQTCALPILPLVEDFAPLWSLSLPGSAAVIQLGSHSSPLLDEITRTLGIPVLETATLRSEERRVGEECRTWGCPVLG